MPKIKVSLVGLIARNNKWDMDSITTDPVVHIPNNAVSTVEDGLTIVISSIHSYMGVTTLIGKAILVAREGVPISRVSTNAGSYIEGEIEVKHVEGKIKVNEVKKNLDTQEYKSGRRIIK